MVGTDYIPPTKILRPFLQDYPAECPQNSHSAGCEKPVNSAQ